jgi:hypothetical protein
MGLGFGALKQMSDTFKYNRSLLGKKKSVREIYKDEIKNRGTTYDKQTLEDVRQRVSVALRRNRTKELIGRLAAMLTLAILLVGFIWAFISFDLSIRSKGKYDDKSKMYKSVFYTLPNGTKLKSEYFLRGPKAADTHFKNGLKHQNSESYYESGEQFRSALYYYDTLITEIYFYKTGDTILNFPKLTDDGFHRLKLLDNSSSKEIEFEFFDGKIVQGTYSEKSYSK